MNDWGDMMIKMHVVIMALFVAVLLVSGCTSGGENTNTPPASTNTQAVQDTLSKEVANDITNVDNTNTDLNDADVDNLDKDLANVNW